MDLCIRYENMEEDFRKISERLGLDTQFFDDLRLVQMKVEHRPKNPRPSERFQEFPDGLDIVRMLCAPEIEAYGYKGPSS